MTTADPDDLLESLYRMMAANAARREKRVRTALATLRRYERRILHEAAVVGYVLGHQDGRADERQHRTVAEIQAAYPRDHNIIMRVIQHCDSTDDLYPYIADACNGRRRRVTKARLYHPEEPK